MLCYDMYFTVLEFTGIKLDAARVFAANALKIGPQFLRKAGMLINTGGNRRGTICMPPLITLLLKLLLHRCVELR